jgi:hypothetical protein
MSLFLGWVVFPLVLGVLSLGCGLLLERVAGVRLPGPLLLPAGFAVIIVAAQFPTLADSTAELTTPLIVALAVLGFVSSAPWRRAPDGWALGSAIAVLAVFAAPIVLSGAATIGGYIKIEDTAIWLALTDQIMHHGRHVSDLPPSSYEIVLSQTLGDTGYPIGVFLPLGVGRALVGQDVAWLLQPYLAFLAAMLALVLYWIVGRTISDPRYRAAAVFIAAQPALLFAYSLFGGIKELGAAPLVALVAALVPLSVAETRPRALLPLAVASAALVGVLSVAGGAWLALPLVAAFVALWRLRGRGFALGQAAIFTAAALAFAIPSIVSASDFFHPASETLRKGSELGNLVKPLSTLQVFGIWPVGDFRLRPDAIGITYILIALAAAAALLALVWAWASRGWETLLYLGSALLGGLVITIFGSPWIDAKALVIVSPAVLVMSMIGVVSLLSGAEPDPVAAPSPRARAVATRLQSLASNETVRSGALAAAILIAGGVLYSNVRAYHDVDLAPHDRFAEMQKIGKMIAGEGPTLTNEYEYYGVRHFWRDAAPEGASLLRRRSVLLQTGKPVDEGDVGDIDAFDIGGLVHYRTLVIRRSPIASRPPSPYRLAWSGRYYELWQRPPTFPAEILDHVSLGDFYHPAVKADCSNVMTVAREARRGRGRVVYVTHPPIQLISLPQANRPSTWKQDPLDATAILPEGNGTATVSVSIAKPGRYGVWLGGDFRGKVEVRFDGRTVGTARNKLNYSPASYHPFGTAALSPGQHTFQLLYTEPRLRPGSGGSAIEPFGQRLDQPFAIGPLALSTGTANEPLRSVAPAKARSLCGKELDWIEAVKG